MYLIFVGCFTWLNVGGGIVLSCNSVYSEFAVFPLITVVVLINEVPFHNPNNSRNFDKHTLMLMLDKLFYDIPVFSCFFMKFLSLVFGFGYHFIWKP